MITANCFAVDPWILREAPLNMDLLPQSESVFALSNGHVGWRGNLDEGEPHGLPGSYLNGVHEVHPLPYAEGAYGNPESGQTAINVTNGKVIRPWSTTSRSTCATAACAVTSESSTSAPGCCGAPASGPPPRAAAYGCDRPGWSPSPSAR